MEPRMDEVYIIYARKRENKAGGRGDHPPPAASLPSEPAILGSQTASPSAHRTWHIARSASHMLGSRHGGRWGRYAS